MLTNKEPHKNGIWCLNSEGILVSRDEWNDSMTSHGVVVIADECAFIIAPHHTIATQFSPTCKGHGLEILETNRESLDCHSATSKIVKEYKGIKHTHKDVESYYDFIGAPAAEFCQNYKVDSKDSREWALPTVVQLKMIAKHIKEINDCFLVMGCPPVIPGDYWSSIVNRNLCAWRVSMLSGGAYYLSRVYLNYVRAVSAFNI